MGYVYRWWAYLGSGACVLLLLLSVALVAAVGKRQGERQAVPSRKRS